MRAEPCQGVGGHVEHAVLACAESLRLSDLGFQLGQNKALRLVHKRIEIISLPQSHDAPVLSDP